MTSARLSISALAKRFGSTPVLRDVNIEIARGEVRGLIGQNGAGKSTLVKTLAGLFPDYDGTISLDGQEIMLKNPRQARSQGIAVIYQEFSLVSEMTVAENLLLGREPGLWRYSSADIRSRALELVRKTGIELGTSVDSTVSGLSPAIRQRIEIIKALSDDVKVLIMDEPTARLSEAERVGLFTLTKELSLRGVAVIFISHYLEEVRSVTDRITIMRNGRVVATVDSDNTTVEGITGLMLGEEFQRTLQHEAKDVRASDTNAVVYAAKSLSVGNRLRNVSMELRAGEITGIAGLVGSGRTRLCRVLAGAESPTTGIIELRGSEVTFRSPREAVAKGVVLIPEDRKYQALSMESSIASNLVVMAIQRGLGRFGVIRRSTARSLAKQLVDDLEIVPSNMDALAGTLSGGNQQKVVLGKALACNPEVLLIDQPTAGVDIGTKAQIHKLLRKRADEGVAVLVVSDDLEELYALSDRFEVLRAGETVWRGKADEVEFDQLVDMIATGVPLPTGA